MNTSERDVVEDDRAVRPATASADPFALAERAVAAIGTTLDERRTGAELAAFLAEVLCDAVAVDLFPQDRETDAPPGSLRPVAAAGRHELLDDLRRTPRGDVLVRALDEGRPLTASFTRAGGNRLAALSVPLLARDRAFGVVLAVRTDHVFTDDETAVAHYAARLAAAHLHHAAEHHAARKTVLNLQEVLLLAPGQPHPNLDVATRYLPLGSGARVGGDWYETVRLHYGRTLLVIGDVMGHGLDAAVDMNAYRSMLRYVASTDLPPHRILRQMDTSMSEDSNRRPATCLLALLDPPRGTVAFSSAGHLPPAVFHRDGTGELVDLPVGPPLGTGYCDYDSAAVPLTPDDTLLMFTDGLVERRDEDIDASLARLARLEVKPGLDVSHLLDEVLDHLGADAADDDVAALAARLRHRGR